MEGGDQETELRGQIVALERAVAEHEVALARLLGRPEPSEADRLSLEHEVEAALPRIPPKRAKEILLRAMFDEYGVIGTLCEDGGRVRWRSTEATSELGTHLEVELQTGEHSSRLKVSNLGVVESPPISRRRLFGYMLAVWVMVESGAFLLGFGRDEWFLGGLGLAFVMMVTRTPWSVSDQPARERYRPTLERITKRLRSELGRQSDALP